MSRSAAATRSRLIGVAMFVLALLASLLVASPPAQAQPPADPQQAAFSIVSPFGNGPEKLPDGTPNDLGMLHQMTVEALHYTTSQGYVHRALYHSGTRDTSRIRIHRGSDSYELHWKTEDLDVVDGQRYRLFFRSAGMTIGSLDVRFSEVEDADPRVIVPGDDVKIRFRMAPNALMRARTLSDSRASIIEAWHGLSEEFDLTVLNRYQILRDEGRRPDQIYPYRATFGSREDKCRTFAFTYTDGHEDAGVWCDSDKDVTPDAFPGLHAASLRLDCKETFDSGQPSKGKSDLAGHTVASWSIDFHDEKKDDCGGESGAEIVPAAPLHVRGTAWSIDDLALATVQEGGATADDIASWMSRSFDRLPILQAIVRSPLTPSVADLIRLGRTHLWAPSTDLVIGEIRQITLADGSPAFTPEELLLGYLEGGGQVAGVLDRLAATLGLEAGEAATLMHLAGVPVDAALVESIRSTSYDVTELLDGIRNAWWGEDGAIPSDVLDGARETVVRASCASGLSSDAQRTEAARLLARAYAGATTAAAIAPVTQWYGDCGATAVDTAEVVTEAFPDMDHGQVARLLTSPPFDATGTGGVAEAVLDHLQLPATDAAHLLISSSVPRTAALRGLYLRGASLETVGDLVHQTASEPLPLPDVVEDLVEIVLGDPENPAPNPNPNPPSTNDIFWTAVDSMDPAVSPCDTILAGRQVLDLDPMELLTGDPLASRHPSLFTPAEMTAISSCFTDFGIDFDVPLKTITVEFTGYMPPTTSVGVPKGVMTGHVGVGFPGLGEALTLPALPAIVAHQDDSFWYGRDCCTPKYGWAPADRDMADPRGASQAFGLGGPLRIVVPDLPDDMPGALEVPQVDLHAGFYTDPRLGCTGGSQAAGMAAAAAFPAELYPNSPFAFREMDQMAFGRITRALDELQAGGTITVPQYATTPFPDINRCSRHTHNDPRLRAELTVTVEDGVAHGAPSTIDVPLVRHEERDWGLGLRTARIDLSGPALLLLLANHNAVPADGQALADYLLNGS